MIYYKEATVENVNRIVPQAKQEIFRGVDDAVDLGVAETMFAHDDPIAAYGFVSMWEGVGYIWAILSEEVTDYYPVALSRRVKFMLEEMIEGMELVRVQAVARCDHPEAREWLEMLGLEVEGMMQAYGPEDGADYFMMALVLDREA